MNAAGVIGGVAGSLWGGNRRRRLWTCYTTTDYSTDKVKLKAGLVLRYTWRLWEIGSQDRHGDRREVYGSDGCRRTRYQNWLPTSDITGLGIDPST